MDQSSTSSTDHNNCAICGFQGVDVRIQGCGCLVHARCIPVTSIVKEKALTKHEKDAVAPGECLCPACNVSPVARLQVLPLNIADLDRAVMMRKTLSREVASKSPNEDPTDQELAEAQAEASYLLLSHGNSTAALCTDNEYQRTGRWTDDEMTYTNYLMEAFDDGKLPIESGLKLNEFLSDVLLCKSSRLTKKMKNARLSTRSYDFRYPVPPLDVQLFSSLEEKFLQSISSEPARIEVHFNLHKHWRSQLCNLCIQIGSSLLDNSAWIASLEDIERRAIEAEEKIRRARRKRVGLSVHRDSHGGNGGGGGHMAPESFQSSSSTGSKKIKLAGRDDFSDIETALGATASDGTTTGQEPPPEVVSSDTTGRAGATAVVMETADPTEDFSRIFDDIAGDPVVPAVPKRNLNNCGPFLDEVAGYVESLKIPFQHVDIWVPSYTTGPNGEEVMRLFNAGHVTQGGLDDDTFLRVSEFGEYSKNFSFCANEDLPGRVFSNNKPRWVRKLDEADPQKYGRSEGAKLYGIKTAFGFPLETTVVDRIVVCVYSSVDVPENSFVINKCQSEMAKLYPEPKWKLVVEMGAKAVAPSSRRVLHAAAGNALVAEDNASAGSSQTQRQSSVDDEMDNRMASLLGEHMPMLDGSVENTTNLVSTLFVPHFMSLRLLLLTPHERRTKDERNMMYLLRKSFKSYSADKNRSNQDLAFLIVKEWQCLQSVNQYTARTMAGNATNDNHPQQQPSRDAGTAQQQQVKYPAEIEMDDFTPLEA